MMTNTRYLRARLACFLCDPLERWHLGWLARWLDWLIYRAWE